VSSVPDQLNRTSEETESHTRLLRLGLAEAESRAYWAHAHRQLSQEETVKAAFEERWFGSRSMARVRHLVLYFQYRFDAYPRALQTLNIWNPPNRSERTLLCHWHLQLSDPLYREFTAEVLADRRLRPEPTIDRRTVNRWVEEKMDGWSSATVQRMASAMVSCATDAGLCKPGKSVRELTFPRISDHCLGYILYLLRETDYEGDLKANPYLSSVGLDGEFWEDRVRKLPWITYRRMADVHDLKWEFPGLLEWAEGVFAS